MNSFLGATTNNVSPNPPPVLPPAVRQEIAELIYAGNKIGAIKRYRTACPCDLVTAKQVVEEMTEQLKKSTPNLFQEGHQTNGRGPLILFVALAIGGIVVAKAPGNLFDGWTGKLDSLKQTVEQKGAEIPVLISAAKPPADHVTPYTPIAPGNPAASLSALYFQKLSNPEYEAWQNLPGIPRGYQDFIEEHHIKYVRAAINANLVLPEETTPLAIPLIPAANIVIDGAIQHQEWRKARRFKLAPEESGTVLYMQADNEWLYLAADVPGDTTWSGYDQFRFFIHVDTDPAIKNERIGVDGRKPEALGGIRGTRLLWQGSAPKNENESWKKHPVVDWGIYRLAMGASTLEQHRQYEAKLNLKESGLPIGAPFPAFVEVETDPFEDGKSRKRMYLGGLGNQNQPVWLILR